MSLSQSSLHEAAILDLAPLPVEAFSGSGTLHTQPDPKSKKPTASNKLRTLTYVLASIYNCTTWHIYGI